MAGGRRKRLTPPQILPLLPDRKIARTKIGQVLNAPAQAALTPKQINPAQATDRKLHNFLLYSINRKYR